MKKSLFILVLSCLLGTVVSAQISAKLMRFIDVSETQITFVYGGDLWIVPKSGGTAQQVTHSPGEESYPRFSPDGKSIAYTASYNGNMDVYTMPITGGVPTRVTYQSHADRMVDWHPDGERLLFASRRELGQRSGRQLFLVDKDGGMAQRLPIPYGELASYSPDGKQLAYITKITEGYPFKRYRGGLTSDILIYNTDSQEVINVTNNTANDGQPAWAGDKVYFLSDQAKNMRLNIWVYDTKTKTSRQVTKFNDFDISRLAAGPKDLVFEMGGTLYRMDLATEKYEAVPVNVISDLSVEMPRAEDVSRNISNMTAAPGSKRIIFEARGELFNVPVKEGYTMNLTNSSGAFDRDPAWSPDGKTLAFWSDRSGEFEVYFQPADGSSPARQMTQRGKGFGYNLFWSPDSKQVVFIDETNTIFLMDATSGDLKTVTRNTWNISHPGRGGYTISWSPNSEWLTFSLGQNNANEAIFCYNTRTEKLERVSSGYFNDSDPVFSADGKYLFYLTNRSFTPSYSDMGDGTWVYPNTTQIAAVSLTSDAPSLLSARNDEVEIKEEKKEEEDKEEGEDEEPEEEEEEDDTLAIDFEDIEARLVLLPPDAGNILGLMPFKGKLLYGRAPNTGSGERSVKIVAYDLDDREEKTVIDGINGAVVTADGKAILVESNGRYGIIKPSPGQKIEKGIPTDGLVMNLVPREEWKQIFNDTWRRHRDFFYDPAMHGLDWDALRKRYGALLDDARTRWDVSALQSNLAAELSAGHTYTFGGDAERVRPVVTGYLGIDWELANGKYRIKRIARPAAWDTEVRSPLDQPGVDVKAGDYILAVNGMPLDANKDPYAAFAGLAEMTVSLKIERTGEEPREEIVTLLDERDEVRLRHLEWIEQNRKMVEELSDGKLGYVYMSNTSGQGQLELVRMYYGQLDKEGFIIDERFNGGGQLADRFLELLQRPVVYNLHWRHGRDHTHPIKTNTGPVGMLINGWAGSGGDGLPWAFQELEAGPIVGERTLGILVGPATGHRLIDGGGITVPGARLYDNDGHWFWEGEGVAPDIEVWDDPNILMKGRDPQVERVVQEVVKLLETKPAKFTPAPAPEDRTAKGLGKQ